VSFPTKHVECSLKFTADTPKLDAREWLVIVPQPENSPAQTINTVSLSVNNDPFPNTVAYDQSLPSRPVQEVSVFAPGDTLMHHLAIQTNYDVQLNARWLEPGTPTEPVPQLADDERAADISATETTDYNAPSFQLWAESAGLEKLQGEDDLTFAKRVFDTIRAKYRYRFQANQDRRASAICHSTTADCGGLSNLFVAVLRNAGIPARIDAGRWVLADGTTDGLDDVHVKSEFYVDGIGWIPVEMSGAVSDKSGDSSLYFGRDSGQFLTMSVNTDYVIDAQAWGTKRLLALQGVCYWGIGAGTFDGCTEVDRWTVADIPDDARMPQTLLTASTFVRRANSRDFSRRPQSSPGKLSRQLFVDEVYPNE
jgi:transglutaminase-like putative cysteine protease